MNHGELNSVSEMGGPARKIWQSRTQKATSSRFYLKRCPPYVSARSRRLILRHCQEMFGTIDCKTYQETIFGFTTILEINLFILGVFRSGLEGFYTNIDRTHRSIFVRFSGAVIGNCCTSRPTWNYNDMQVHGLVPRHRSRQRILQEVHNRSLLGHTAGTTTLGVHAIKTTIKKVHPSEMIVMNGFARVATG